MYDVCLFCGRGIEYVRGDGIGVCSEHFESWVEYMEHLFAVEVYLADELRDLQAASR